MSSLPLRRLGSVLRHFKLSRGSDIVTPGIIGAVTGIKGINGASSATGLPSATGRSSPTNSTGRSPSRHHYATMIPPTTTTTSVPSRELSIRSKYRMPCGYDIPVLGFGVYQTPAAVTEDVVRHAFRVGYRHIDSARAYRNEQPCADAIRASGLKREDIFFTTKVPPRAMGYEATKKAIESSFAQTGLDYIDLYLIHCPYGGKEARAGTWRALVEAQKSGKIRSLGVSNYGVDHLQELETYIKTLEAESPGSGGTISVGQWELHPWCDRSDIVSWCRERNIVLQAYCPIVRNQRATEPLLQELAEKYGRSTSQVLIRWSLQMGFVPLPKSENHGRIEENAGVFGWELEGEDVRRLDTGRYEPCSWDPTVSGIDN